MFDTSLRCIGIGSVEIGIDYYHRFYRQTACSLHPRRRLKSIIGVGFDSIHIRRSLKMLLAVPVIRKIGSLSCARPVQRKEIVIWPYNHKGKAH